MKAVDDPVDGSQRIEGIAYVTTVFLVDDHEVVRSGLAMLLESAGLSVVGEAGSVDEAMRRIPAAAPDVAVVDVRLPDGSGIDLCGKLGVAVPTTRTLILTSVTDDESMLAAVVAGASGYLVKDIKGMALANAVEDIAAGRSLLDSRAAAALMNKLRNKESDSGPWSGLSEQERRLVGYVGEGLSNREIAQRMFLAEKTVKNYVSRVLAKLGMQRRAQIVALAATNPVDPER